MITSLVSRAEVEDFLFEEADLLDDWQLRQWLDLFDPNGTYYVPSTDRPDGDQTTTLFLIADDMARLRSRVTQLLSGATWAENPQSRTRHLISNVQIKGVEDGVIDVTANFVIYRMRFQNIDPYIGKYFYKLIQRDGHLKILERRAILDLEALRPHGKVSFIV
jgi:p-cumate 2,3-dioxygenase beta subunit